MITSLDAVGCKAFEVALAISLFEQLDKEPGTIAQLAQRCQVSARGLRPLLFLLASVGCVQEQGATFHPSPELHQFLEERWPEQQSQATPTKDWEELEKAVRTALRSKIVRQLRKQEQVGDPLDVVGYVRDVLARERGRG